MEYQLENIKIRLKTKPVDYDEQCRPVEGTAYENFNKEHADRTVPDIWEKAMPNTRGWLGVVDETGETAIEGEFKTYTHTGPYGGLMEVCKNIAREHPGLTEFYCVYLNSPLEAAPENLQTKIVFREE